MIRSVSTAEREIGAVDRLKVERLLEMIGEVEWQGEGRVAGLVETPEPHRHAMRQEVVVVERRGFAGDHAEKSYYRGEYVAGREVSAMSVEVLNILGVDPVVVGDNLITVGIDLRQLRPGDRLAIGGVILERSNKAHRPCTTFRNRTSSEAFAVASRDSNRGALFNVVRGGTIRTGDHLVVLPQSQSS